MPSMPRPNQIDRHATTCTSPPTTCSVPDGPITEEGLRHNINVGIQYLESWLGQRLRPHLQPDGRRRHGRNLATQVWQWIRHRPDWRMAGW